MPNGIPIDTSVNYNPQILGIMSCYGSTYEMERKNFHTKYDMIPFNVE